jgi:hypothetical protein
LQKKFEETVNGRTDNKTAKGKETKRPTMIFKTLRRKLKIEQHVKELKYSGRINSSFSTGGTRRVTFDLRFLVTPFVSSNF